MLAQLTIELETNDRIGYLQSSLFHGVLMEHVSPEYAEILHESKLHPYSQYLLYKNKLYWIISTTNQEAYQSIIEPLLKPDFDTIHLDKKDIDIKIINRSLKLSSNKELLNKFYLEQSDKYLTIEFITPTAFKSDGHYIFIPDVRLIF